MAGNFYDTNVLLYLAGADRAKAEKVEDLLRQGGTISVQVLNEIANVTRRKMGLTWLETRDFLEAFRGLLVVQPLTLETHESGLALAERHGFSTYDAMIVAAALLAECETLWSEDMQNGMTVGKRLQIVNPFQ
ncbi:PIN domain-containing protein [Methylovirgula sp. 4M-Z18]|uniref:PIN domain-containing protein n=1 Tax=Methylovirgula sp. 4M-Z18 TaxID=2293567 RepID=UPI000E2FF108|nr:PIN domain-containing protein [Methylovirgula sp. 4M-Z18]RFB76332.1 PIN domain-containing protein [Methylovirgula sp. 4M-Z18]